MGDVKSDGYYLSVLEVLRQLPKETEWVEFKENVQEPQLIGEYISALANSAGLIGKVDAWLVWGISDLDHSIVGTRFKPSSKKKGNEELENWLLRLLNPQVDFRFHELQVDGHKVVLLRVQAAINQPVQFAGVEYIRIGSHKKKLKAFPEKERALWQSFDKTPFERAIAMEDASSEDVLQLFNYPQYFNLIGAALPSTQAGILSCLEADKMIVRGMGGKWNITHLGAILFASKLNEFDSLSRKAIRVVFYEGINKVEGIREFEFAEGYACCFENIINLIVNLLPTNEVVGRALRAQVSMFPELAIRELVANAIIHQDFRITGTAPMVEVFLNRFEVTNPGLPLVEVGRFLDSPPRSRNEALASFMRRIGICEERGSGIDKIVSQTEFFQLPAPLFETTPEHTRCTLFAYRDLNEMDKDDRIRACYLHACLKFVMRDPMTNSSLRGRFGIDAKNSAIASRIIKESLERNVVKAFDPEAGRKFMKYVPFWA